MAILLFYKSTSTVVNVTDDNSVLDCYGAHCDDNKIYAFKKYIYRQSYMYSPYILTTPPYNFYLPIIPRTLFYSKIYLNI